MIGDNCKTKGCIKVVTPKSAKGMCPNCYKKSIYTPSGRIPNNYIKDGVGYIELKGGKYAMCDADIFEDICKNKWSLSSFGYPQANRRGVIQMHKVVNPSWVYTDHINRNRLDNRKLNLRKSTHQQNSFNCSLSKNNSSGYKGVSSHQGKWRAYINLNGKQIHIGMFDTAKKASDAHDKKAKEIHGEFAYLNQA